MGMVTCAQCEATVEQRTTEFRVDGKLVCAACAQGARVGEQAARAAAEARSGGGAGAFGLAGAVAGSLQRADEERRYAAAERAPAAPVARSGAGATCPRCGTAVRELTMDLQGNMVCQGCAAVVAASPSATGSGAIYLRGFLIVLAAVIGVVVYFVVRNS